jgi:hypothetical protein
LSILIQLFRLVRVRAPRATRTHTGRILSRLHVLAGDESGCKADLPDAKARPHGQRRHQFAPKLAPKVGANLLVPATHQRGPV